MHVILDAKYKRSDLHKIMETQCQILTMTQSNELFKILQKFKEFFNIKLSTWKTDPAEFD